MNIKEMSEETIDNTGMLITALRNPKYVEGIRKELGEEEFGRLLDDLIRFMKLVFEENR